MTRMKLLLCGRSWKWYIVCGAAEGGRKCYRVVHVRVFSLHAQNSEDPRLACCRTVFELSKPEITGSFVHSSARVLVRCIFLLIIQMSIGFWTTPADTGTRNS